MLILIFSGGSFRSGATHISGADLTYKWISGNTFELSLTLYRDCSGITAPNSVNVNYKSVSCGYNLNIILNKKPGTGQEITRPCNSSATTCTGGTSPGIQKYEYIGNVTLPALCTDWVFGYTICCRNCAITTLTFSPPTCAGAPAKYIEARLNNVAAPHNSSPVFSNLPVSFFCIGQPFHYNHGAFDFDGDSIVYSFIPPRSAPGTNVVFTPPYSATNPISSSPPLSISPKGDILLTPTAVEVGVMAILVSEYRNGVLVGSVVRDMQTYTQACSNALPTASGVNGTANYNIVACPGKPLSFNIISADADAAQAVTMDWNYGIPGSSLTFSSSTRPIGTFNWTPSISDARSQPYTFTVTVTDDNCPANGSQTYSYSVIVPPLSASATPVNALCANSGGSISVQAVGIGPFQYLWTPGNSTNASISGAAPGIYSVKVSDQYGCTVSTSATLSAPPALNTSVVNVTPVSCYGGNNGSASISVSGGVTPYQYTWSNSTATGPVLNNAGAGSYTVTVRDANNCLSNQSINILQAPPLSASSGFTASNCGQANGSASVTPGGGSPPYSYAWNPGNQNTQNLNNLSSGIYSVTVSDSKNCSIAMSVSVPDNGGPTLSIQSLTAVTCKGGSNGSATVSLSGGTAPFIYTWQKAGQTIAGPSGLSAGNYTVTVTDANNCSAGIPFVITEPSAINLNFATNPVRCPSSTDGSASVLVSGGIPPYTYTWSPGNLSGSSVSGLAAGTYSVSVRDQNACLVSGTTTVNSPSPILANVSTISDVSCNGNNDGSAMVSVNGGTSPYRYSWTPYGGTSSQANGLGTGTYTVTVTDANNCSVLRNTTVSEPPPLSLNSSGNPAGCGLSNGSINLSVNGGTNPYTYNWSHSAINSPVMVNVASGSYQVIIRDNKGCTLSASIAVSNTNGPSARISSLSNVSCFGGNNGSARVTVTGGQAPFSYQWSMSSSTDETVSNLSAGSYTVQVIDSNNCSTSIPFSINQPLALFAYAGQTPVSCYGGNDGQLTVNASGGTAPYTYLWSNGQTGSSINQVRAGNYSVIVSDNNSCITNTNVDVLQAPAIFSQCLSSAVTCAGGQDGQAQILCSGGTGPYTFTWSNGITGPSNSGLSAGVYTVIITDANGCSESNSANIPEPAQLNLSLSTQDASCYGKADGAASALVNGGTAPYTYSWPGFTQTSSSLSNLAAGNYSAIVNDAHGCRNTMTFSILAPMQIQSTFSVTDVSCQGGNDGTAAIRTLGGSPPYFYFWDNGSNDSLVRNLSAGSHVVIISDRNACTETKTINVNEPPAIHVELDPVPVSCIGQAIHLHAQANGGRAPYTFQWSNGVNQASQVIYPVKDTVILVQVMDAASCPGELDSVRITLHPPLLSLVSADDSVCSGTEVLLLANASGGNGGPYHYQWSDGSTMQELSVRPQNSISYTIQVSDDCGTPPVSNTVHVIVFPDPDPQFIPNPVSGCAPLSVQFNPNDNTHLSDYWEFGDGQNSSVMNPVHTFTRPGEYTISHHLVSAHYCRADITIPRVVTVYPPPVADFIPDPAEASIQVPQIQFSDRSNDAVKYSWDFGDQSSGSNQREPVHTYRDTGIYDVKLIVQSAHSCPDTIVKKVRIKAEFAIYIPNAFTPNNDGVNEEFMPLSIGVKDISILIYDRWGLQIFHSDKNQVAWNGKVHGTEKPCQADVYVYVISAIDLNDQEHRYTGRVTLFR